jgi:hypothetical protein
VAPVSRAPALAAALALAACGKLQGFSGEAPPLATFNVTWSGDVTPLRPAGSDPPRMTVALVWGANWLVDPFCLVGVGPAVQFVKPAGCPDPFSFAAAAVAASAPLDQDGPTGLTLAQLPPPDVMVGDYTASIAYGSLVLFDDVDGDGTLGLARPHRFSAASDPTADPLAPDPSDVIYGASFVTMTAHDRRVAYREGGFDATRWFYPRAGCAAPPPGFSVVDTGGFTPTEAFIALATQQLPGEDDPGMCSDSLPEQTSVDIPVRPPAAVQQVGCDARDEQGLTTYLRPPSVKPDTAGRVEACANVPPSPLTPALSRIQWVVSGRSTDRCKGLTHYALRGCYSSASCTVPNWDDNAAPPPWWTCPHDPP